MRATVITKTVLLISTAVALAGCSPPPPETPTRILSLSTAATRILTELGTPPAAIDEYSLIAASAPFPPVIGRGTAISQEQVVELGLDGAVAWYYQADAAKLFRDRGLRVETIRTTRLADFPEQIIRLGEFTGQQEKARQLAVEFRRKMSGLSLHPPRPVRVYFELYAPGKAAGNESYIGDLLRAAGGQSILEQTGLTGMETLAEAAPEYIFFIEGFANAAEISSRPGLSEVPAVKNGRIHPVPRRLIVEGLAPLEAIDFFKQRMR